MQNSESKNSPSRLEGVGCETARSSANLKTSSHSVLDTESPKNVPKLRFKEFSSEWVEMKLGDLLSFKNGINATKEQYGKGYKFINVLDIINNNAITHNLIIGSVDVSETIFNNNSVEYGDVLFQRSSETREEAGQSSIYLDKDNKATFGGFVIRGKKTGEYNPFFMNYLLKTESSRKEITIKSSGSTRYNVGQDNLSKVKLPFPTLPEQQKIADCLSTWDEAIETQKSLIEIKKLYKKSMMQKLFSQEIRFKDVNGADYPDWVEKKLGEVCDVAKSGGTPKSTVKEYYSGNIPFLAISDITKQGKYLSYTSKSVSQEGIDNSASWIVPKNTIIYSMYASVGFVSISKIPLATSQAVINLVINKNFNIEFIYYHLLDYKQYIHRFIETGTQGNLNAQTVKSLVINLPTLAEQTKIANFLSAIDEDIELLESQLAELELQKKGLMQGMFV